MSKVLEEHESENRMSNNEISKMIEHIQDMHASEHQQIFNIIKESSCRYTENLNGVFINLAHVPNAVLVNIQSIINFWQDQKHHIAEMEKQRSKIQDLASADEDRVSHRSETYVNIDSESTHTTNIFNESTIGNKKLSQKELQLVRGTNAKKKHIGLNKGRKDMLKNGDCASRVAKKCLAAEEDV